MNIYYLTSGDVLKGRVEPILWMRTAEWLAKSGFKVRLISTYFYRNENISTRQVFQHYGIDKIFKIVILPTILSNLLSNLSWMRLNCLLVFFVYLAPIYFFRRKNIFFSKAQICMQVVIFLEIIFKIKQIKIYELHAINSNNTRLLRMLKRMDIIIVNSQTVANDLKSKGIDEDKILQLYNAPFASIGEILPKEKACEVTKINPEKQIVMHIGKLLDDTITFFIQAANTLKNNNSIEFHLIGGNPDILQHANNIKINSGINNIFFHGFVAPSRIHFYMSCADILVCYYSDSFPRINQATPAKCSDYLLSGRPFLCSNNTAIGEFLTDSTNCLFFSSHDHKDFVLKINLLLGNKELSRNIVSNNTKLSKSLSWEKRISKIVDKINQITQQ